MKRIGLSRPGRRPRLGLALVCSIGSLVAGEPGGGGTTEQRLQALEGQVQSLHQENVELRRKLGLEPETNNLASYLKPAGKAVEAQVGGFVQVRGEFGDPGDARWTGSSGNDRFYLRRARLHL
jgi:hypothetical protein